jgi:phosphatidylglycerophosphate synthase
MPEEIDSRRPLKTRTRDWAKSLAGLLVRRRVSPNVISVASIFFAAIAGAAFYFASPDDPLQYAQMLVIAALGIQGRLLCNMLDGMVAVEGGRQTKSGEVFNDLPDRISDIIILVQAGYTVHTFPLGRELGWIAALLAVLTAYVRMMGGAAGLKQSFMGPMAKQHRMAVLTAACVLSLFESWKLTSGTLLWVALIVIVLGSLVTIVRRTINIVRGLEAR